MGSFSAPDYGFGQQGAGSAATAGASAPLVVLFERDDAIAVPLISELRMARYDVRSARTPVELFDLLSKNQAALVLIDLGVATAARREFWIALDAQRRGRSLQVMTFRNLAPGSALDIELDATPQPLADIDVRGPQDFPQLIAMVRQRVPLGQPLPTYAPAGQPAQPGMPAIQPGAAMLPMSPYVMAMPAAYPTPATTPAQGIGYPGPQPYAANTPGAYPGYPTPPTYGAMPTAGAPAPMPYGAPPQMPGQAFPGSPFAHPSAANPFAVAQPGVTPGMGLAMGPAMMPGMTPGMGADSPFAQPYAINPFSGTATEERHAAPAASAPKPVEPPVSPGPFGFGANDAAFSALGNPFDSSTRNGAHAPSDAADQSFSDTWTPPDAGEPTGRALGSESTAYLPVSALADQRAAGWESDDTARDADDWGLMATVRTHGSRERVPTQATGDNGPTLPVEVASDGPVLPTKTEMALSSVLLEGALLTPSKLDVLKGVQQMLANTGKRYKIGELALLFRFLSPDQLLAALLVSRGLVSPQQIAGLGRVKQELAASGMDHDLESLLSMFNILPEEQLRQLRAELA